MSEIESDEKETEVEGLAKLTELDRTGDKAKYLASENEQVIIGGAENNGVLVNIPPEAHDLPRIGGQREQYPRGTGKEPEHSDTLALYSSVILSIATLALAAYSLVSFFSLGTGAAYSFPISSNGFLFMFVIAAILSGLFIYIAASRVAEIRIHRYLKQKKA
jgi:hypothetical protein